MDKKVELPIYKDKYDKMGVTALELYMRQNGLCWLVPDVDENHSVTIYCTDGKDKAETSKMLNPTFECVQCMMCFTTRAIEDGIRSYKSKSGENPDSDDT